MPTANHLLCSANGFPFNTGVFLGLAPNTLYQIINGQERLVQHHLLLRNPPPVTMASTVGVKFANSIYSGIKKELHCDFVLLVVVYPHVGLFS